MRPSEAIGWTEVSLRLSRCVRTQASGATEMTEGERDLFVATEIRAGRCPFGKLQPGETIAHCPSGFPGCGCGDELMLNPNLQDQAFEPAETRK